MSQAIAQDPAMLLTFTKRGGKHDDLLIERDGQPSETIACPKQGIIPHDMVHYAVESVLAHRGFLTMVAEGQAAGFGMAAGGDAEAVERLVETFQAEMWSGRVPAAELLAMYEHACGARGHPAVPVTAADIEAVRARLDALTAEWSALPVNGVLAVGF